MRRLAALAALAAALAACDQAPSASSSAAPAPPVIATFYTLWDFTRQVAGDAAPVTSLVPLGVAPHDWEPSPRDIGQVEKARVFIYNGAGFETWIDKVLVNLGPSGPAVVDATAGIPLLPADLRGRDGPGSATPDGTAAAKNPHVWLDPILAQAQVENIRAGLARSDPAHAARYAEGARALTERLAALHATFEKGLAVCARREIVVSHAAFTYLAHRYRLIQMPVMGLSPEAEPGPAEMARIVRFARRHEVTHIFFETLVAPKLAETLAREVGATPMVLNPIEGLTRDEAAAGKGYEALMAQNLANLRTALQCR